VEVVRELHGSLDTHDQQLFRHSLFAGIEMRDQREYHAGDFLIRNVIGIDADAGLLALAARPKQYQAMQFHLRDRRAASEDLQRQLERHRERRGEEPPAGALLFSCLGRGEGLYEQPNHDSDCLTATLGETALGGFFCNGEIGQVGEKTYLHGYTSAVALFYPGNAGAS
jgi:small ligand-binding sensory domain FIST